MSEGPRSKPPLAEPTNRWWRALRWVAVVFALLVMWVDLDWALTEGGVTAHGHVGAVFVQRASHSGGVAKLARVRAGGQAAIAGFREGDEVATPNHLDMLRVLAPGEQIELRRLSPGSSLETRLTAVPSHDSVLWSDWTGGFASIVCVLPTAFLALFILLRGGGRPAPVLLGLGLAAYALCFNDILPPTLSWPPVAGLVTVLLQFVPVVQYLAFLYLGAQLLETVERSRRGWLIAGPAAFALLSLPGICAWLLVLAGVPIEPGTNAALFRLEAIVRLLADASSLILFVFAWWRSTGNERKRLVLLIVALACVLFNQLSVDLNQVVFFDSSVAHMSDWWLLLSDMVAGVIAPVLFAYAILKNRILDLGFALNRTLVYSAVSAILLAAFGLIEWSVDHFVKIEGREKNALIDAAIALGVFLAFHRVRDFVERAIETLFFRSWQQKEARLRKFVGEAAFITQREAVLTGLAGALSKFAEGAETAIYLGADDGGFVKAAGAVEGAPPRLEENDPALVTLRAERKPLEPQTDGSALNASLCAPMTYGSDVRGFALLGPKPHSVDYRPDEIELIGWAVVQVGLDLHALDVTLLKEAVRQANTRVDELRLALGERVAGAAV